MQDALCSVWYFSGASVPKVGAPLGIHLGLLPLWLRAPRCLGTGRTERTAQIPANEPFAHCPLPFGERKGSSPQRRDSSSQRIARVFSAFFRLVIIECFYLRFLCLRSPPSHNPSPCFHFYV